MQTNKQKTNRKKTKRDFVDFIKAASNRESTLGKQFLDEVNKEGAKARDLHQYLVGVGFEGVRLEDCTRILSIVKTRGTIRHSALQRAY